MHVCDPTARVSLFDTKATELGSLACLGWYHSCQQLGMEQLQNTSSFYGALIVFTSTWLIRFIDGEYTHIQ